MQPPARARLNCWTHPLLPWCFLHGLPLQGIASVTAEMQGAKRFHRRMPVMGLFMEKCQEFPRSPYWSDAPRPVHSQEWFQRDHQSVDDPLVVRWDAWGVVSTGDVDSSGVSAIWSVPPPAYDLLTAPADVRQSNCPKSAIPRIRSCDS